MKASEVQKQRQKRQNPLALLIVADFVRTHARTQRARSWQRDAHTHQLHTARFKFAENTPLSHKPSPNQLLDGCTGHAVPEGPGAANSFVVVTSVLLLVHEVLKGEGVVTVLELADTSDSTINNIALTTSKGRVLACARFRCCRNIAMVKETVRRR
jgi:hypothetical protein